MQIIISAVGAPVFRRRGLAFPASGLNAILIDAENDRPAEEPGGPVGIGRVTYQALEQEVKNGKLAMRPARPMATDVNAAQALTRLQDQLAAAEREIEQVTARAREDLQEAGDKNTRLASENADLRTALEQMRAELAKAKKVNKATPI